MPDGLMPPGVDVQSLGDRVFRLRSERGLTQSELAGGEFTRAFVSAVEAGKRKVSPRAASQFAQRLGMATEDFYFGYPAGTYRSLTQSLSQARIALSAGDIDKARQAYTDVVAIAQEHDDRLTAARGLCGQGRVARHIGDPGSALELFERAASLLDGQPSKVCLEAAIGRVGALFAMGAISAALSVLQAQLGRESQLSNPDHTVQFALLAATVLPQVERGDFEPAAQAAQAALTLAPDVADPEVTALGYYHISRVLVVQGQYDKANEVLSLAIALFEHLRLPTEVGMCHFARGFVYARQDRLDEAVAQLRSARRILSPTGAIARQVNANAELADVLARQGDLGEASAILAECRALTANYNDPEQTAELDRIGARIALANGQTGEAETLLRSALNGYTTLGARSEMAATSRILGELLLTGGRTGDAISVFVQTLASIEAAR